MVMTLGLTHTLFILLSVELLLMAANVEEDIKIEIIKHLGMKKTPDTKHVSSIMSQTLSHVERVETDCFARGE